jgi:hypothetical protein
VGSKQSPGVSMRREILLVWEPHRNADFQRMWL